jgi:hypothetical protein
MEYYELFRKQMNREIAFGSMPECRLESGDIRCPKAEASTNESNSSQLTLFPSLDEFYSELKEISVNWSIAEGATPIKPDTSLQFKNDLWLDANYYKKGYSWEAVKILLSGSLHITTLPLLVSDQELVATAMDNATTKVGLKVGDLRPFDFNEFAVACFKVEDGKLIDNVFLYTGFGGMPERLIDMGVTFEKYLDLAYKAKCFNYWNLIYCLKEETPHFELMKRFWPVIFRNLTPDLEEFGIKY